MIFSEVMVAPVLIIPVKDGSPDARCPSRLLTGKCRNCTLLYGEFGGVGAGGACFCPSKGPHFVLVQAAELPEGLQADSSNSADRSGS